MRAPVLRFACAVVLAGVPRTATAQQCFIENAVTLHPIPGFTCVAVSGASIYPTPGLRAAPPYACPTLDRKKQRAQRKFGWLPSATCIIAWLFNAPLPRAAAPLHPHHPPTWLSRYNAHPVCVPAGRSKGGCICPTSHPTFKQGTVENYECQNYPNDLRVFYKLVQRGQESDPCSGSDRGRTLGT